MEDTQSWALIQVVSRVTALLPLATQLQIRLRNPKLVRRVYSIETVQIAADFRVADWRHAALRFKVSPISATSPDDHDNDVYGKYYALYLPIVYVLYMYLLRTYSVNIVFQVRRYETYTSLAFAFSADKRLILRLICTNDFQPWYTCFQKEAEPSSSIRYCAQNTLMVYFYVDGKCQPPPPLASHDLPCFPSPPHRQDILQRKPPWCISAATENCVFSPPLDTPHGIYSFSYTSDASSTVSMLCVTSKTSIHTS